MIVYAIASDGTLLWYRHRGSLDGSGSWEGPSTVGNSWQTLARVFASGSGVVYAIQDDGTLLWYRHEGRDAGTFAWTGPNTVGTGWNQFIDVFNDGGDTFYAIGADGTLHWYKHLGHQTGAFSWQGPNTIGNGWQNFLKVFPGRNGVIYAIRDDGVLLWYKHLGHADGSVSWEGPREVGSGWQHFRQVFSGENGTIYAIQPDGRLLWYRHLGADTGTADWQGPNEVGSGWLFDSVFTASEGMSGYCWPLSARPGGSIAFKVSSPTGYSVRYVRFRRLGDQNEAIPLTAPSTQPAGVRAVPDNAWSDGCGWPTSFELSIPDDWASGIYAAECRSTGGQVFHIVFVVKPQVGQFADFAMLANTNTWNAYNGWGGRSKYSDPAATQLSFLRPNPAAAPIDGGGINHLTRAELWIHDWLSTAGYRVDVFTDTDFHVGIDGLSPYKGLLIHTHPEYWSQCMLTRLRGYIAGGGSVLYLGGNGLFEEVRFSPEGDALTLFTGGPSRSQSYLRNLDPPQPERAVLGVAYRYDNYMTFAPFQVMQASHRFFAGTGLANGDVIGASGLNGGGASGWEMDTSIPGTAAAGVNVGANSAGDDRGEPPAGTLLLARGTNTGPEGAFGADMTVYETSAGGFVFAAGSISFGGSLVVDPTLQRILRNVLDECL